MLNYYYHPILGLQYDYLGELFLIDIECIPQNIKFDTEQWIRYLKETRVQLMDACSTPCFEIVGKITNYKL